MVDLIEQSSHRIEIIGPLIKAGHYDLIAPDGSTILPSVWEQCIEPGWLVSMRLWKDADDAKREEEYTLRKKVMEEARVKAEEELKRSLKDEAPIRFKDAI
ncbi:hypothetical protein F5B20DRAFT_565553 [Whalleya microplaca]|nr:hypothetical protein F5B20DRAFT_565553 [Whalleya microplaca]